MRDLKNRKGITDTVKKDEKDVGDNTKQADKVTEDTGHIDSADKKIKLKGTAEGAKEITGKVSDAMDKTKKVHEKLDNEQNQKFGEIKKIEADLSGRASETRKDIQSINQELGKMSSKDTADAKGAMKEASEAGKRDVDFMNKAEGDEKKTRTTGEGEMKKQTSRMKSFKTRRL